MHGTASHEIQRLAEQCIARSRAQRKTFLASLWVANFELALITQNMYPTPQEAAVIAAAEQLMTETMARYDPSHDAFHGAPNHVRFRRQDLTLVTLYETSSTRPQDRSLARTSRYSTT
jgi:hypothetical protein